MTLHEQASDTIQWHTRPELYRIGRPAVFCLPDIVEAREFLDQLVADGANVIALVRSDWLESTPLGGCAAWISVVSLGDGKAIESAVRNAMTALAHQIGKIPSLDHFVCFAEKHVELMAALEATFKDDPSRQQAALLFRDKLLMRQAAAIAGIDQPKFARAQYPQDMESLRSDPGHDGRWKCIAKPRSSWGALGVRLFENYDQLEQWISVQDKATLSQYLVETFVSGDMFHVDAIVTGEKPMRHFCFKYGVPIGLIAHQTGTPNLIDRNVPSGTLLYSRLCQAHDKVIAALGLKNGLTHVEFFVNESTDAIFFCEAACRPPGCGITRLHRYLSGVSTLASFARHIIGKPELPLTDSNPNVYGMISFTQPKGRLVRATDLSCWKDPEIICFEQQDKVGRTVDEINFLNELGRVYLCTRSPEEFDIVAKRMIERFQTEVV